MRPDFHIKSGERCWRGAAREVLARCCERGPGYQNRKKGGVGIPTYIAYLGTFLFVFKINQSSTVMTVYLIELKVKRNSDGAESSSR
jgi:hypothetical protein